MTASGCSPMTSSSSPKETAQANGSSQPPALGHLLVDRFVPSTVIGRYLTTVRRRIIGKGSDRKGRRGLEVPLLERACTTYRTAQARGYWSQIPARQMRLFASSRTLPRSYFQRKCTKTRPKLSESFSTRWYSALISF